MEKSCGAVIICENEFLVVKHRPERGNHWDFPKGHVEKEETEEETAKREVYEETGLKVRFIQGFRDETKYYPKPGVLKTVVWFIGLADNKKFRPITGEIIEHEWLPYDKAMKKLTFKKR